MEEKDTEEKNEEFLIENFKQELGETLAKEIIAVKDMDGNRKYRELRDLIGKDPGELSEDGISKSSANPLSRLDAVIKLKTGVTEGIAWLRNQPAGEDGDLIHQLTSGQRLIDADTAMYNQRENLRQKVERGEINMQELSKDEIKSGELSEENVPPDEKELSSADWGTLFDKANLDEVWDAVKEWKGIKKLVDIDSPITDARALFDTFVKDPKIISAGIHSGVAFSSLVKRMIAVVPELKAIEVPTKRPKSGSAKQPPNLGDANDQPTTLEEMWKGLSEAMRKRFEGASPPIKSGEELLARAKADLIEVDGIAGGGWGLKKTRAALHAICPEIPDLDKAAAESRRKNREAAKGEDTSVEDLKTTQLVFTDDVISKIAEQVANKLRPEQTGQGAGEETDLVAQIVEALEPRLGDMAKRMAEEYILEQGTVIEEHSKKFAKLFVKHGDRISAIAEVVVPFMDLVGDDEKAMKLVAALLRRVDIRTGAFVVPIGE